MADELEVANQKMEISDDSPQTNQPDADMIHTEDTRVETERKVAAPGKKLVKVQKTRTFMDAQGYMVNEDYDSYEERDDV